MYPELILMAISGGFIIIGAIILRDGDFLLPKGKKAEAIIFQNNYSDTGDGIYFPVVRFLTDKQEWITQELRDGFNPPLSIGDKVEVLYDPENPTDVNINSSLRLKILPTIFIVLGTTGLVLSLFWFLGIIHLRVG